MRVRLLSLGRWKEVLYCTGRPIQTRYTATNLIVPDGDHIPKCLGERERERELERERVGEREGIERESTSGQINH